MEVKYCTIDTTRLVQHMLVFTKIPRRWLGFAYDKTGLTGYGPTRMEAATAGRYQWPELSNTRLA